MCWFNRLCIWLVLSSFVFCGCLEGSGLTDDQERDTVPRNPLTQCPLEDLGSLDGPRAFVSVANDDYVAVLDLSDPLRTSLHRCIETNPNPEWEDEPFDVLTLPNGDLIVAVPHAAQFVRGEIWRIPNGGSEPAARVELSGEPDHLALSPDGDTLYVSSLANINNPFGPYRESGELAVLALPSLEVRAKVPVGLAAAELAVISTRSLVVASPGLDALVVIDTETFEERILPLGPDATRRTPRYLPFSLVLSSDGAYAFVSCLESREVRKIRLEDGAVTAIASLPDNALPYGLAVDDARGTLTVADAGRDLLLILEQSGLEVRTVIEAGPPSTRGRAPYSVLPLPDSPWALVTQSGDPANPSLPGSVVLVDLEEGRVVHEVDLGRGPRHIDVSDWVGYSGF